MKEKELEKQLNNIRNHIKNKEIIKKALGIARKYGQRESHEHSCHTNILLNFIGKDYAGGEIRIKNDSGWSMFGGEDLEINYNTQQVFYADTSQYPYNLCNYPLSPIKIGELYIHKYSPGEWEKQLVLIYQKGPKIEKKLIEKPVGRDVDKSKLEDLARKLPIKIK